MKGKRFLVLFAALSVVGMAVILVGCGQDASSNSNAQQQFLAERGSGTPVAGATPSVVTDTGGFNGGPGGFGGGFGGVFGTIDKIDGNKITVSGFVTNTTTTIELANDAKVYKQAELAASDIKAGDAILATGTQNGSAIDAFTVEVAKSGVVADLQGGIGGGRIFGGGGGQFPPGVSGTPGPRRGNGQFPQGTPGARRQRTPGAVRTPVAGNSFPQGTQVTGTVEKVDGNTITIKPTNAGGAATINLTTNTRIQELTEIKASELQVGNSITAMGTQNGDVYDATRVQVIDAARFRQQTPTP